MFKNLFILEFQIRIPEFRDFRELENQNLEKLCFIKIIVIKGLKVKFYFESLHFFRYDAAHRWHQGWLSGSKVRVGHKHVNKSDHIYGGDYHVTNTFLKLYVGWLSGLEIGITFYVSDFLFQIWFEMG